MLIKQYTTFVTGKTISMELMSKMLSQRNHLLDISGGLNRSLVKIKLKHATN